MLSLSSILWTPACLWPCICRTQTGQPLPPEFQPMHCACSHPMTNSSSTACSLVLWLHQTSLDYFMVTQENGDKKMSERQWCLRSESDCWTVPTAWHLHRDLHLIPLWQEGEQLLTCSPGNCICFFQSSTPLLHGHI